MLYVQFYKVTSLPTIGAPHSWYLLLNGGYCETYVTDNAGAFKKVGNSDMINELIVQALDNLNTTQVVNNITDRDNLTLTSNTLVYVIDATGDATVSSGAALYIYRHSTTSYHKIAEYESVDLNVTWGSISGKPTSTPTQIDQAVTDSHTHSNKTILDGVQEAFTTVLKTAYDGVVNWISTNGTNILNHLLSTSNPHSVTKSQVGLGNVPNLDTTNAVTNQHTHSNKPLLDSYTQTELNLQDAVTKKHSHVNQVILDSTTESFSTLLKTSQATTTTGSRWTINTPSFTTLTYKSEYTLTAAAITNNQGLQAVGLPAASNASSLLNGNIAIIEGVINTSAVGNVIARFASEVASSAITAKIGSYVEFRQLN